VTDEYILRVEDLHKNFGDRGVLHGISFNVRRGETVGLVGETGCGKSTLGKGIPRLLPEPPATIGSGTIVFRGTDIVKLNKRQLPMIRGTGIGMIFQEPLNSLNPAYRVFDQIVEAIDRKSVV
jgi:ABC-type dipeptide/oligopeptide/nickel transport system ATPase component